MALTKDAFKKIILLLIGINILTLGMEYSSIFSNYEILEEQLHQGYLHYLVSFEMLFAIFCLLFIIHLASLFLLLWSKPSGRLIYLISFIAMLFVLMLNGDFIQYSLLYPLEILASFLEIFILYLIYFTPLKKDFSSP
jgi:hypothetical protein